MTKPTHPYNRHQQLEGLLDFLRGAASIFDLFGTLDMHHETVSLKGDADAFQADAEALRGDWTKVVGEIRPEHLSHCSDKPLRRGRSKLA